MLFLILDIIKFVLNVLNIVFSLKGELLISLHLVVEVLPLVRVLEEDISTSFVFFLVLLLPPPERQSPLPFLLLGGNGERVVGQRGAVSAVEEVGGRGEEGGRVVAVDARRRIFEGRRAPQLLVVLLLEGLAFEEFLDFERAGLAHGVGE